MPEKNRPNVLLLIADQWRGDCLGAAGHPDVKTPFLDTLAGQGMRFENAYSATPSCIPARAAVLTGMRQEHHGRVGYKDGVSWRYENTLPGCFIQAGYQTHCAGKMHVHPLRARLGFESIDLHDGFLHYYNNAHVPHYTHQNVADDYCHFLDGQGHKALTDTGLECNGWPARPWMYDEALHPTHWTADKAIDFLRRRERERPFFLTASFVRPHPPLDAPEAYFAPYRAMSLRPPITGGDWEKPVGQTNFNSSHGIPDAEYIRQAQQGYYACITQADHQMGRIIEAIKAEGEWENTIVMFISDHGEMLGDHNLFRKAVPYEGSVHVPMLLAGPGVTKGVVRQDVAELQDVMPTLLAAAGLDIPGTVDGENLLAGPARREWIHGEHAYGELSNHYLVTDHDKYIWFSQTGEERYFDLVADPDELHNAAGDAQHHGRVAWLRGEMIRVLAGREEGYSDGERLVAGRTPQTILSFLEPCVTDW